MSEDTASKIDPLESYTAEILSRKNVTAKKEKPKGTFKDKIGYLDPPARDELVGDVKNGDFPVGSIFSGTPRKVVR